MTETDMGWPCFLIDSFSAQSPLPSKQDYYGDSDILSCSLPHQKRFTLTAVELYNSQRSCEMSNLDGPQRRVAEQSLVLGADTISVCRKVSNSWHRNCRAPPPKITIEFRHS